MRDDDSNIHVGIPKLRGVSEQIVQEGLEGVALQSLSQCPSTDSKTKNASSTICSSRRNSNSQGPSLTASVIVNVPTSTTRTEEEEEDEDDERGGLGVRVGVEDDKDDGRTEMTSGNIPVTTSGPTSSSTSTTDSRPHIRISSL